MAAIPGTASSPWMPPLPSVYRVVNELVATNSGEFVVYDPDGIEIGRVAVAATFSNQIKFMIADGSTDFAIGDAFSITVRRPTTRLWPTIRPAPTAASAPPAFFGKASQRTASIS